MPEIHLTEREARILLASVVIALDWMAVWERRDGHCWVCGSDRVVLVGDGNGAFDLSACADCRATFGPVR